MTRVVIIGAGGHAQVIADAILSGARYGLDLDLAGFVDDDVRLIGQTLLNAPVLGPLAHLSTIAHEAIVIGIGDNATRARLFDRFQPQGEQLITVIHPCATVATDVQWGRGCVVFAGAVINTGAIIGDNVIVNTGATIDHHARIGAHVHIAPGVHLGGSVTLGEGVFLGIGSSMLPNRMIGQWTIVGAGAAVIHDLPEHVTAVGAPARVIKQNVELDRVIHKGHEVTRKRRT